MHYYTVMILGQKAPIYQHLRQACFNLKLDSDFEHAAMSFITF